MNHEFLLADIGEGLEEAEIIEWRVAVGDFVSRDQPIVEVMTDKSNADLPAPHDGVIVSLGGAVGDLIEVGQVIAVIDDAGRPNAESAEAPSVDAMPRTPRPVPAPSTVGGFGDEVRVETDALDAEVFESQAAAAEAEAAAAAEAARHAAETPPAPETFTTFQAAAEPGDHTAGPPRASRPKAAPSTRVEAARRGIDLADITGSGPGGRILLSDLDQAATGSPPQHTGPASTTTAPVAAHAAPAAPASNATTSARPSPPISAASAVATTGAPLSDRVEPLRGMRRAIANNMAQSWSTIPHIHAFDEIDAEPLLELREQLRSSGRHEYQALTPLSFFTAAVAAAMHAHPQANATLDFESGTITHHGSINVGVAVAAPNGLVVPVVSDADRLSFADLTMQIRGVVDGARAATLDASAFRGGTATITNFGALGGQQAVPLIRPPESVIFGFGSIEARPFVLDDTVVPRKTMHIVVGADHRLLDGDVTTSMLARVAELLTNPINLVLGD